MGIKGGTYLNFLINVSVLDPDIDFLLPKGLLFLVEPAEGYWP